MRTMLLIATALATSAWTEVPMQDRFQPTPEQQHVFLSACATASSIVNGVANIRHPYIADIPRYCECSLENQLRFIPKDRIMQPESSAQAKEISLACLSGADQAF